MKRIGIIGAGRIGSTLAVMLNSLGVSITIMDRVAPSVALPKGNIVFLAGDAENPLHADRFVKDHDAIVSAGPFYINKDIATRCAVADRSYFDFTEDVTTTSVVRTLAAQCSTASLVPQCGLAPGAINIIAAALISEFDTVQSAQLRVGALPRVADNHLKYCHTWSIAGLVNEYLQPCPVLKNGHQSVRPALSGLESIVIDGATYEAFHTSGGIATMCETFAGKIDRLDYKTLRYPGHNKYVRFLVDDLGLGFDELCALFVRLPTTDDDKVVIAVIVTGTIGGRLVRRTYHKIISPSPILPHPHNTTAIQVSTASAMAAVVELWLCGNLPAGFVAQESISLAEFKKTTWGRYTYAD